MFATEEGTIDSGICLFNKTLLQGLVFKIFRLVQPRKSPILLDNFNMIFQMGRNRFSVFFLFFFFDLHSLFLTSLFHVVVLLPVGRFPRGAVC